MPKLRINILLILLLSFLLQINAECKEPVSYSIPQGKYQKIAAQILDAAMKDTLAYERLAYMCDTFGPRLSGSVNLNEALKWIEQEMQKDGLENVRAEEVMVPHWVRGNEYCKMLEPRNTNLHVCGLGGSIATPPEGITAPIVIIHEFEEMQKRADEIKGKIVVYEKPYAGYGDAVKFRYWGAVPAASYGAVASIARSATPSGMQNPHTGSMGYADSVQKIPHASISTEDAAMLERMVNRGQHPVLKLYMEAKMLPDTLSYNVMGEIKGKEKPEEILVVGGHSDSWDLATGAHDDGGGCIAAWHAVKLLKDLGLRPRRTIRAVMFVNEENGVMGGKTYAEKHKDEPHFLLFEFDAGVFPPQEINYQGGDSLFNIIKTMEPLLQKIDSITVKKGGWGVDITPMAKQQGIPAISLNTKDNGKYFWYHHAATDMPDAINPEDLKKCVAAIALSMYICADLP